jgi:hypothetical protein
MLTGYRKSLVVFDFIISLKKLRRKHPFEPSYKASGGLPQARRRIARI